MAVADFFKPMDGVADTATAPAKPAAIDPHSDAATALVREKFLPVTRHALLDRLTRPSLWPNGDSVQARRFLRYLDYWRRHAYSVKLIDLEQVY